MNNYSQTTHKIRQIYNESIILDNDYDNLNKDSVKKYSINYVKKQIEYTFDAEYFTSIVFSDDYILELKNFPILTLPYIKVIPIIYTTEAYSSDLTSWFSGQNSNISFGFYSEKSDYESIDTTYNLLVNVRLSLNPIANSKPKWFKLKIFIDYPRNIDELRTNKA